MTKEEYIEKQKNILERAIEDTFKDDPIEMVTIPALQFLNGINNCKKQDCICIACENTKFYLSHIKPRTIICSKCFYEKCIDKSTRLYSKRGI